jgi:hypothetical protein
MVPMVTMGRERPSSFVRVLFGRFNGTEVSALPTWYIGWLIQQPWLKPPLRPAILAEHARRAAGRRDDDDRHRGAGDGRGRGDVAGGPLRDTRVREAAQVIVRRGFASAAHATHPDHHGGDHEAMVALNRAHEALRALVGS